jgi:hypothetical protein
MRLKALLLIVAGAIVGALIARRFLQGPDERIDLYFEDGSMVSLDSGSPEAQRLLPVARDLLSAAG